MATVRLPMRSIREVLRQKLNLNLSHRKVARATGVSSGAVGTLMARWKKLGLTWEEVEGLTEEELELRINGPRLPSNTPRPKPDMLELHNELKRPGVTLELLHIEYLEKHPENGYRYSRFCELYERWLKRQRLSMRQVHRAGEKFFIDYSGKKLRVVDLVTGQVREVELYVGAMGASNYLYAEATWTQQVPDFVGSTTRALEFLGGVPGALVIDCLKSGVTTADRYESVLNRTYEEMARHYDTVVLPARPWHPKDKAKVEVAVQIAQRWILARLRKRVFHSLGELNAAIAELVDAVNERTMRQYGKSRQLLFDELDKPALKALPSTRYEVAEWKQVRVNIDYHVELFGHWYSVPHALRQDDEALEARATSTTVEVFRKGLRVAVHARSYQKAAHTTVSEHMPKSHRAHAEWSATRFLQWAGEIGPQTRELIAAILEERPHPEMGYRSCLGILRLSKRFGPERLEKASERALRVRARSYRHLATILEKGLESTPLPTDETPPSAPLVHENLRGPTYYH
jgi:transposase